MVLPRARSALSSAMLCSLWFHFRRTGQARATACASTVSHDAFLITLPSGPPSPRWRSTCAHRQCSRAPSASLAAATTHSLRTFSLSPTTRGPTMTSVPRLQATTKSSTKPSTTKSSTTAQPQQLRRSPNSAAARRQRNPELQQYYSKSGSSAKTSPPWLMFHRLPSVLNL